MAHHSDPTPARVDDSATQSSDSATQSSDSATQADDSATQTDDHRQERFVTDVLLSRRRRYALYYLHEHSGPVSLDALAVQVAAWERATTPNEVTAERVESVYTALRETHVPYFEAHDLVAYDCQDNCVVGQVDDPTVELYVRNDPRTTIPWYRVYLALTVVSTVLLGLAQADVSSLGALSPIAMAALIVVIFAMASVAHWYDVFRWRRRTEEEPPDFVVSVDEEVPYEEREEREDREDRTDNENER